jgi:hypothetical protein
MVAGKTTNSNREIGSNCVRDLSASRTFVVIAPGVGTL